MGSASFIFGTGIDRTLRSSKGPIREMHVLEVDLGEAAERVDRVEQGGGVYLPQGILRTHYPGREAEPRSLQSNLFLVAWARGGHR